MRGNPLTRAETLQRRPKAMTLLATNRCIILPASTTPARGCAAVSDTVAEVRRLLREFVRRPRAALSTLWALPLFWALSLLLICAYWNAVFHIFAELRYTKWLAATPDPDANIELASILFRNIPPLVPPAVPYVLVRAFVTITLVRFLLTPYRWVFLRRYAALQGVLLILHGLCVFTPILPTPGHLQSTVNTTRNVGLEAFSVLFGLHSTNCLLLFSTEASTITLCACFWHHYSHKAPLAHWDPLSSAPNATPFGYPLRLTTVKLLAWVFLFATFVLALLAKTHVVLDLDLADVFLVDHAHERAVIDLLHLIFHQQRRDEHIEQQHDQQDDAVVVQQRFLRRFYFFHKNTPSILENMPIKRFAARRC